MATYPRHPSISYIDCLVDDILRPDRVEADLAQGSNSFVFVIIDGDGAIVGIVSE